MRDSLIFMVHVPWYYIESSLSAITIIYDHNNNNNVVNEKSCGQGL